MKIKDHVRFFSVISVERVCTLAWLQDEGHRRGCLTVYQPRPIGYLRLINTAR